MANLIGHGTTSTNLRTPTLSPTEEQRERERNAPRDPATMPQLVVTILFDGQETRIDKAALANHQMRDQIVAAMVALVQSLGDLPTAHLVAWRAKLWEDQARRDWAALGELVPAMPAEK